MDVTKLPSGAVLTARTPDASSTEQGAKSPFPALGSTDRADIRPLDLRAALQILLAEVRASLDSTLELAVGEEVLAVDEPPPAARGTIELLLRVIPDEVGSDLAVWNTTAATAEVAVQSGLDRAMSVISAWQGVAPSVLDAVSEARELVMSMLADGAPNPIWARPEWAGLLPRFNRYWRRRRAARRLHDPDYPVGSFDNNDEYNIQ